MAELLSHFNGFQRVYLRRLRGIMGRKLSQALSRRAMLRQSACGFGMLGLASILAEESKLAAAALENPLSPKPPHFAASAKRVIFLFMQGGPSSIDTFNPRPRLTVDHGKPLPFKRPLTFAEGDVGNLMKSPWAFKHHGQSGIEVSDLFPSVGSYVDDICVIRSMVGDSVAHGGAEQQRYELDMLQSINRQHALQREYQPGLEGRIQAFELAFRMQTEAPDVLSIEKESPATQKLYGLDREETRDFGWQCLLARRLSERGVRFVQATHSTGAV